MFYSNINLGNTAQRIGLCEAQNTEGNQEGGAHPSQLQALL